MTEPRYRRGLITVGQAAQLLATTRSSVNDAIEAGHLYAFRTSSDKAWWLIRPADLARYVDAGGYRYRPSPRGTIIDIDPAEDRCARSC